MLELHALLDEGAHAKVYRARFGELGECAAKVLSKCGMSATEQAWVRQEIKVHRWLLHPHIVALHEAFETECAFTLVLALCRHRRQRRVRPYATRNLWRPPGR